MYSLLRNYQAPMYSLSQPSLEYIVESAQPGYTALETQVPSEAFPKYDFTSFSSLAIPTPYQQLQPQAEQRYQKPEITYQLLTPHREYHFIADNFLKPGKEGIFVGKAEEIKPYVEETFERIFQQPFPNDVRITLCSQAEFRKIAPSPSTVGISFNRKKHGLISEIFVLNDSLGRVLLTVGHEIGHVLTETLVNTHDEEAKAFAFSLAWMEVVQQHNIAGLADAVVTEIPADNGLHNVAFSFIQKRRAQGETAWEIYLQLLRAEIAVLSLSG